MSIRKAICRSLVLFVVAQVCWVSCGTPGIRLCGSEKVDRSGTARLRSGPKAVIVAIDFCNVDDGAAKRTDPNSMRCDPGKWYRLPAGEHVLRVKYYGLYQHTNPPYKFRVMSLEGMLSRLFASDKNPIEVLNMVSDSTLSIKVILEPNKRYEVHVELDCDKNFAQKLKGLPALIAPRDPNIVLFASEYSGISEDWFQRAMLVVPRASDVVVTGFPWEAYVEDWETRELESHEVSNVVKKAIDSGNVDFVKLLRNTGENFRVKGWQGTTPLHLAAIRGQEDIVREFLETGLDVNVKNEAGCTPLFYAAGEGHRSIVNLLLLHGAKVDLAQQDGWTPLHHAALGGHLEVVKILVEKGAKVNAFNRMDMTPLFLAADQGYESVVKFLLEKEALVNIHQVDGFTPLHYAALDGHVSICKMLLEAGAEVNAVSKTGMTPLHDACLGGHVDVARLLLQNKADVNAVTRDGWTVMHMAAYSGNIGLVGLLKEYGYKTDANAKSEISPKEVAKAKGNMLFRIAIEGKK